MLIYVRYKVHPVTEKLNHKAHLCRALMGFLQAALGLVTAVTFSVTCCASQSHCLMSVSATTGGGLRLSYPLVCVCVCVCQTYVLTAKTTTFNGTLTVDRAALLPVFLFVCTSEGKAFLLCHTEGLRAENNCSSLGRGDIRDFCRGVFVFLWLRKSPDLKICGEDV